MRLPPRWKRQKERAAAALIISCLAPYGEQITADRNEEKGIIRDSEQDEAEHTKLKEKR
jgi:hypothetical protein